MSIYLISPVSYKCFRAVYSIVFSSSNNQIIFGEIYLSNLSIISFLLRTFESEFSNNFLDSLNSDWTDLNNFSAFVEEKLPSYAQPVFVRIIEELETTGTFKLKKNDLREEAYHPDKVKGDKIFIKKPGNAIYSELDKQFYDSIQSGQAGF